MKTLKAIFCFVLVVAAASYIYDHYYSQPRTDELKKHGQITDGVITEVTIEYVVKGGKQCTIKYEYEVNNAKQNGSIWWYYDDRPIRRDDLYYKHFPIIYSTIHPNISAILIDKDDSAKYGIK